jgi:hypothetical protein
LDDIEGTRGRWDWARRDPPVRDEWGSGGDGGSSLLFRLESLAVIRGEWVGSSSSDKSRISDTSSGDDAMLGDAEPVSEPLRDS